MAKIGPIVLRYCPRCSGKPKIATKRRWSGFWMLYDKRVECTACGYRTPWESGRGVFNAVDIWNEEGKHTKQLFVPEPFPLTGDDDATG